MLASSVLREMAFKDGARLNLNNEQLKDARATGQFTVFHPTEPDTRQRWQLNSVIQSGTNNITKTFKNIMTGAKKQFTFIPNRLWRNKHVSINHAVKSIGTGIKSMFNSLVGLPRTTGMKKEPIIVEFNNIHSGQHQFRVSTSYVGWRWANFFVEWGQAWWNGCLAILKDNLVKGPLGIPAMWCKDSLGVKWFVTHLKNLWAMIQESRQNFEAKPDDGIFGKTLSRFFNRLSNYVFKLCIGTVAIVVFHIFWLIIKLLLTIVNIVGSVALLASSPVWSLLGALAASLFRLFIYDDIDKEFVPFFRVVIWDWLLRGIGQGVSAILGVVAHILLGFFSGLVGIVYFPLVHIYDGILYGLLRWQGRVPVSETFMAHCIYAPPPAHE